MHEKTINIFKYFQDTYILLKKSFCWKRHTVFKMKRFPTIYIQTYIYVIGKRFKIESSQKHMACMIYCLKYEVKSE